MVVELEQLGIPFTKSYVLVHYVSFLLPILISVSGLVIMHGFIKPITKRIQNRHFHPLYKYMSYNVYLLWGRLVFNTLVAAYAGILLNIFICKPLNNFKYLYSLVLISTNAISVSLKVFKTRVWRLGNQCASTFILKFVLFAINKR